jgi:hypothetical protein
MRTPAWSHDVVQRWFLQAVREPPRDYLIVTLEGWRAKRREAVVPGWGFRDGNVERRHPNYTQLWDVVALADGRRGRISQSELVGQEAAGFNLYALRHMAELAHLPPLPARPKVWRPSRRAGAEA